MYEVLLNSDGPVSAMIVVCWLVVCGLLARPAASRAPARVAARCRSAVVWIAIGSVPVLLQAAAAVGMLRSGRAFASDWIVLILPMVLVPAILTWLWAVPVLHRVRRLTRRRAPAEVPAPAAALLGRPGVAVPPMLVAVGGVLAVVASLGAVPISPLGDDVLRYGAVYALAAVALVLLRRRSATRPVARFAVLRTARVVAAGVTAVALVGVETAGVTPGPAPAGHDGPTEGP